MSLIEVLMSSIVNEFNRVTKMEVTDIIVKILQLIVCDDCVSIANCMHYFWKMIKYHYAHDYMCVELEWP